MLRVKDLWVDRDGFHILGGVNLEVSEGEIVCILGPNGAGKSTLMNAISGLVRARSGSIELNGTRIDGKPTHEIVGLGIAHVLERRRLFPYLTAQENLTLGSYLPHARAVRAESLERVLSVLPDLAQCLKKDARHLSGGQQQQLAIARGLMSVPALLLMDEPLIGLTPKVTDGIAEAILRIRSDGVTVVLIEQNVERALQLADRGYILESGTVATAGTAAGLLANEEVVRAYLGY